MLEELLRIADTLHQSFHILQGPFSCTGAVFPLCVLPQENLSVQRKIHVIALHCTALHFTTLHSLHSVLGGFLKPDSVLVAGEVQLVESDERLAAEGMGLR